MIVTFNSSQVIAELLDSIPAALGEIRACTVVVDNGSTDCTRDIVTQRTDCTLVASDNAGYAAGINRGVLSGPTTPAILVLNPDVRLAPRSVLFMMETLGHPSTGIVCPRVHNPDGSLHHSLRREPSILRTLGLTRSKLPVFAEYVNDHELYETPQVVDWAVGAIMLISRECFDEVGGWDESFFLYSEETEFCLRARDLGYLTRYDPRAIAIHIGGQSGQSATTHTIQIVNRVRLYRRRHGPVASFVYLLLTALRESIWIGRGGPRHVHAIRALFRPRTRPAELASSERILRTRTNRGRLDRWDAAPYPRGDRGEPTANRRAGSGTATARFFRRRGYQGSRRE